jgi:accessory colonization factor AcfC
MQSSRISTSLSKVLRVAAAIALVSAAMTSAAKEPATINVYGPGGPAPAMKEAAQAYGAASGVQVNVVAGPTPQWVEKAKADADVVFSGAENMMSDFAKALPGAFDLREAEPLFLRPVAILVRPGNPKGIQGFRDLLKPGGRHRGGEGIPAQPGIAGGAQQRIGAAAMDPAT